MDPWTLRFVDAELEAAYRGWFFVKNEWLLRRVFLPVTALLALIGPLQATLAPALWPPQWQVRYFALVVGPAACLSAIMWWPRLRERLVRRWLHELLVVTMSIGQFGIGWIGYDLVRAGGDLELLYAMASFMFAQSLVYLLVRLRFVYASGLGLAATLVGLGVAMSLQPLAQVMLTAIVVGVVTNVTGMFGAYVIERTGRRQFCAERAAIQQRARADALLATVMPTAIAERLKAHADTIADEHADVSVLFADVVGFTPLASTLSAEALAAMLDELFHAFDDLAQRHGVEKIKTIGDAWMGAAGLDPGQDDHAVRVARLGQALITATAEIAARRGLPLRLRVGAHAGPVVAGVIGQQRLLYDLWGDTVNVAARLEAAGEPGRMHVSDAFAAKIRADVPVELRGEVALRGRGDLQTAWVGEAP